MIQKRQGRYGYLCRRLIEDAMKETVEQCPKLKYVQAILRNWQEDWRKKVSEIRQFELYLEQKNTKRLSGGRTSQTDGPGDPDCPVVTGSVYWLCAHA